MEANDLKFHDKVFKGHVNDRAKNTKELSKKLDELKPKDFPEFPDEIKVEIKGAELLTIKGEKGDKPTDEELLTLIKPLIPEPIKGEDGRTPLYVGKEPPKNPQKGDLWYQDSRLLQYTGIKWVEIAKNGRDGIDGKTPNKDEIIKEILVKIPIPSNGIDGRDGKNGKDFSGEPKEIVKKITSLKGDKRLHITALDGLEEFEARFNQLAKGFVSKTLQGMADVNITSLVNGYVLTWDSSQQKFKLTAQTGLSGTASFNETPSGTIDGTNSVFTLAHTPNQTSVPLQLFVNGARQASGGIDFTLSGATITFITPPEAGSVIFADYYY